MTERSPEELTKIVENLGLTVSPSVMKRLTRHKQWHATLVERTGEMSIAFSKQTPLHCLFLVLDDDDAEETTVVPLVDHLRDRLRFAPDDALKQHEKTPATGLYTALEHDGLACKLADLGKPHPHVSNAAIVDADAEVAYLLSSAQGKSQCGPVVVIKARTSGTTSQQAERILAARHTIAKLIRQAEQGGGGDDDEAAEAMEEEAPKEKKSKAKSSKKHSKKSKKRKLSSSSSAESPASVAGSSASSDQSAPSSSSSSSSSSSEEAKRKKKKRKDKHASKHRHHRKSEEDEEEAPEKKQKKKKPAEKKSKTKPPAETKKPKKATPLPPPIPSEKKKPTATPPSVKKPSVKPTTAQPSKKATDTGAKPATPTPPAPTAEQRQTALGEAAEMQRRTEELIEWCQSLPRPLVQ